ncbi:MAG TPA: ATP-dependent Clp protease proteolytic subunit [bacterium]|nr:ATP-dependent Clp protease proteolytic subunit [bacterium]
MYKDFKDSPFNKLISEVNQAPEIRQGVIREIEKHLKGQVVTFFTSFSKPDVMITDGDAEMLESVLSAETKDKKLYLILNSPGGDILAAERIVNLCRSYFPDGFEVIVPHMAKSAGTIICFGADAIHMSQTSELGPTDPQFLYVDDKGKQQASSAQDYIVSYETLFNEARSGQYPAIQPYMQQLDKYDARLVQEMKVAQLLSRDVAVRLLQKSMMKGKKDDEIIKAIEIFLTQEKSLSHGRMITREDVRATGLNVLDINIRTKEWDCLWELYVRSNWVTGNQCGKLIESSKTSVRG